MIEKSIKLWYESDMIKKMQIKGEQKKMLFIERYEEMLDELCGDIDCRYNDRLIQIMGEFAQPKVTQSGRYDTFKYKTDAFMEALNTFNSKIGNHIEVESWNGMQDESAILECQPIAYLFSIIELQYEELLSDNEKADFACAINSFFNEKKLPWRLLDGQMKKLDSRQFECDIKARTLELMSSLRNPDAKFQSAFEELVLAVEALERGDYESAINNAGKSYESVMKIILEEQKGNASSLTKLYMERVLNVPDTMNKEGFQGMVMMSLPFIRNNSGTVHGAGLQTGKISKPMANLAVNLAAALDTYLIEAYVDSKMGGENIGLN